MQETKMAAQGPSNDDYFYPGSVVKCTTCYGDLLQGEVMAFDYETKTLLLKQPASSGKPELNNVALLNMDLVKHVDIIKDCTDTSLPALSSLNHQKLIKRFKAEVDMKMKLAKALKSGVSREGIHLYLYVKKTIDDCLLNDQNIEVLEEVLIKPPYKPENCLEKDSKSNTPSSQCLEYVKGIVEKFHKEERLKSQSQPSDAT